tara:strand:- start:2021 stop:2539 length:519 start_codon:yes stop_codon:yes gene_type:complete
MSRATRFFLFKTRKEFWIVDENSLQDVPKPRELIVKKSQVEQIRQYVITQNKADMPIVDRCRDRTTWHTPEGREAIRQAKMGDRNPNSAGLSDTHRSNISRTMKGTREGEFNPMYGRRHKQATKDKIRQKAFDRPPRKWCVEPSGERHLIPATESLPESWQWGTAYDPYKPA